MSRLSGLRQRLLELLRPDRADRELQEELRDHFEREVARLRQDGAGEDEARRTAAVRTGARRSAREAVQDERSGRIFQDAWSDLRFAARALRRTPVFTTAVVLSLALGIGGTTAMAGAVHAVLLRPLPYPDADRLFDVRVWWNDFSATLSPADVAALEELQGGDFSVGAFFLPSDGFAMQTPAGPQLVEGAIVTAGFPRMLRISPIAGQGFSSTPNAPEALISERLWRERYDGSPEAIGKTIVLDGDAYTILGVMPDAWFSVRGRPGGDAWLKALSRPITRRGPFYYRTIVRVKHGLSPESASAALTAQVRTKLRDRYGVEPAWEYRLRPLKGVIVSNVGQTLVLLLAAMCLVLIIAVVNITNLFLARGTVRTLELSVRAALGAGRARLTRHLLVESALLGALGGAAGSAVAFLLRSVLWNSASTVVPRLHEQQFDWRLTLFAISCGVVSGLTAGLLPAIRMPWTRMGALLRSGTRGGEEPGRARTRQALVSAEIALTVTVLTGAVLLMKSYARLQGMYPGFEPGGVASFRLSLPDEPYGNNEERLAAFVAELQDRLRGAPGVTSVALAQSLPPDLLVASNNYTIEGTDPSSAGAGGVAEWTFVTEHYFQALGIRHTQGRMFDASDRRGAPGVAIVNHSFVRRHYADGLAIGKRLKGGDWDPSAPWVTIVGVVADVPYSNGLSGGADATVYRPYAQGRREQSPYVVVKVAGDPAQFRAVAQQIVAAMDANLPLRDFATMDERLRRSNREPELRSLLFGVMASLALALSVVGINGVVAYHVTLRRREMAIRRALGATVVDVVSAIVGVGFRMVAVGLLLGVAGALAASRMLSTMLFQVSPNDPSTLAIVAGVLAIAALLACAMPALRTAAIDPASVLREE